jgi:hypothetical protein
MKRLKSPGSVSGLFGKIGITGRELAMKQCSLYMTLPATESIGELIQKFLPGYGFSGSEKDSSLVAGKKNLLFQQKLNFSFITRHSGGEDLSGMLLGMHNFYAAVKTPHKQLQRALLAKIKLFDLMVIVSAERDMDDDTFGAVMGMAKEADALIFLPPGNLYNGDGELVFNANGETTLAEDALDSGGFPDNPPERFPEVTASALARKDRSLEILQSRSVPVDADLPPIIGDEYVCLRTKEAIIQRSTALLITAIYAEIVRGRDLEGSRAIISKTISTYQAESFFSREENAFLQNDCPKERDIAKFIWRYECYWVALWVLGFVQDLEFPQNICDVGKMIRFLHESGNIETFAEQAVLRPVEEILDQTDLIYRYDWACVDAHRKGLEAPASLDPGVVVERHRMFNWIICSQGRDWDDVSTDIYPG